MSRKKEDYTIPTLDSRVREAFSLLAEYSQRYESDLLVRVSIPRDFGLSFDWTWVNKKNSIIVPSDKVIIPVSVSSQRLVRIESHGCYLAYLSELPAYSPVLLTPGREFFLEILDWVFPNVIPINAYVVEQRGRTITG